LPLFDQFVVRVTVFDHRLRGRAEPVEAKGSPIRGHDGVPWRKLAAPESAI